MALVQEKNTGGSYQGGGTTSFTLTFASAISSAGAVEGSVSYEDTVTLSSIVDDKSNTYTALDTIDDVSNGQKAASFVLGNITNAPKTLTFNFSSAVSFGWARAAEYSSILASANPVDQHAGALKGAFSNAANNAAGVAITTTVNGCTICADLHDTAGSGVASIGWSAGTGFTIRTNQGVGAFFNSMAAEDAVQTTAGSITPTFTASNGGTAYITFTIALKPASGSPSVNLSGAGCVASAGSLAPNDVITIGGASATASAGSVTSGPPVGGASVSALAGSASLIISKSLSGAAATASAGSVSETDAVSPAGAAVTASAGSVGDTVSPSSSGAAVTAMAGNLALTEAVSLVGAAVTALAGSVSFSNALNVGISGAQVSANAGLVSDGVAPNSAGAAATALAGTLSEVDALSLIGAAISALAGSLADVVSPAAAGAQVVAQAGSVSFSGPINVNISGAAALAQAGSVSFFSVPLSGAAVTAQAGTVTVSITLAVTGVVNPLGRLKMYTGSLGAVSNQEDWIGNVSLTADDGTLFNMAGAVIEIFVTDPDLPRNPLLSGSVADGHIVISGDGLTMTWHFSGGPNGEMSRICAGTYTCFCKLYLSGLWTQLFAASVGIVDGGPNS